jgi:hypothetical protein
VALLLPAGGYIHQQQGHHSREGHQQSIQPEKERNPSLLVVDRYLSCLSESEQCFLPIGDNARPNEDGYQQGTFGI